MPDTDDPNNQSGETNYQGPERRTREPSVIVSQHAMPPGYRDMSPWQKAWSNFGALGVGMLMLISFFLFFQNMYKDEIQDRRARDAEDREIRRAEVAQQDRRSDAMVSEIRQMRLSFETVASDVRASTTELRTTREKMDVMLREMKTLLDNLINSTKKTVMVIMPCEF